jgi:hypothetical protein
MHARDLGINERETFSNFSVSPFHRHGVARGSPKPSLFLGNCQEIPIWQGKPASKVKIAHRSIP